MENFVRINFVKKVNFYNRSAVSFSIFPVIFQLIILFTAFSAFTINAQELPEKIRGYKIYNAKISIKTENDRSVEPDESEALVRIGDPEFADISLTGITFELTAEIDPTGHSGTVDFLMFRDFRVNGLEVEIEEYKESFSFKKNQTISLPKPVKIFIGTGNAVSGALKESRESKADWTITGRVFVFGKFKKLGFKFKRVVPVDIDIKIPNPVKKKLAQTD